MTTWEPSNGIVFASKTRPTARDRTWSPSNDIPFAGTPLNKAHYATKRPPVKPSAATVRPAKTAPARMPYKAVNTAAKLARPPAPKPYTAPTKAAPASLGPNAKPRAGPLNLASRPIDAEETRRLSEEAKRRTLEEMKAKELAEEQKRKAEVERQRLAEVARAARVLEITNDFQRKTSQFEEAIGHIRKEYLAVEDEIQEATLEHRDALGLYSGRKSVLSPNFDALIRHKVKGLARRAREIKRELDEERLEAKRLAAVQERLASLPQPSPEVVKLAAWMDGVTELVTDVKAKGEAEERAEGRKSYDAYRTVFEPLSPNVYAIIKDIETLCELFKRQEDKYKDLSKGMDSKIVELVTLRESYRWATGIVKLIDNATLVSAGMKLDFEELHGWQRRCRELWQRDRQDFQESLYDIMATAHQSRRLTRQIRYNLDPVRGYPECWQTYNFDIAWITQNENVKLSHEDLRLVVDKLREWQSRTLEDRSEAYKPLFECWDKCEMFHRTALRPRLINLVEDNGIVNHVRLSWMANNAPLSEVERYRGVYLFLPVQYTADAILRFQRDIFTSTRQEGSWLRKSTLWRKIDQRDWKTAWVFWSTALRIYVLSSVTGYRE
ncbi:hypothetical protein W97_04204 [Coniosporium apollinis CBS 100218]|uniref:Uncharacterized protein n=1 Tax=Coniosporium apollinis (strain CBS 100218) TaxID=1168221 RepID=R7YT17_CONA1|nr:uncharacterized protein W97_04204 [Coniosporium apollinis CBS 100218]EON64969.1 hypothetical protein W97_04204 [Coniosporium apollinis CBS 100218]